MQRRDFLASAAVVAAATVGPGRAEKPPERQSAPAGAAHRTSPAPSGNRIGVSTYSFWGFSRDDLRDVGLCIDNSARMGFDGVEILQSSLDPPRGPT